MYKVKEVAEMVGVSVRTLHHYNQIGLLIPESSTNSGYRLYTERNLEQLQQIMFFKEMGFSLHEIKGILEQPNFDRMEALKVHKDILSKKKNRLEEMIYTVDKTMISIEGDHVMNNEERFKGFNMSEIEEHQKKYSDEAKQRYGKEIVEASEKKVAKYTKDDWEKVQGRSGEIYQKFISRMENGPGDEVVQEAVGEWQQYITDNFYDCTLDILGGLGDLYVTDKRFTKNLDKYAPGFAQFLHDAIQIFCSTHRK